MHTLSGHGGDVKCVDWHPHKGLLASGGKDSLTILWDAREGKKAVDIHAHKNQVTCLKWNANGNWLATGCKDQTIKVFDIRTMKELENFRGHTRDVTAVVWHPQHETLLTSGGYDGTIMYWIVGRGQEECAAQVKGGHEAAIWSMTWHPAGHILCSGSNDNTTKFWCRNRPGEVPRDTTVRSGAGAYTDVVEPPTLGGGGGGYRPVGGSGARGAIPGMAPGGPPPPAPPPGAPRGAPPPAPPPGRPAGAPAGAAPGEAHGRAASRASAGEAGRCGRTASSSSAWEAGRCAARARRRGRAA